MHLRCPMGLVSSVLQTSTISGHSGEALEARTYVIWELPKIRGPLFWDPYNKDPTMSGTILGSPIFGNSHIC